MRQDLKQKDSKKSRSEKSRSKQNYPKQTANESASGSTPSDKSDKSTNWQSLPLFKGLTTEELAMIGKEARLKTYSDGATLLSTESKSSVVYILLSGRVKIFVTERHGYNVTLALREAGELLGEISAIQDKRPTANVVTVEPCTLLGISKSHFLSCWRSIAALSFNIGLVSAARMRSATEQIAALSTMDAKCRVARQLRALASWESEAKERDKGKGILPANLTQQELAEMVGCCREQVNRILKKFVAEGLLTKEDKNWVILSNRALDEHCQ